LVTERLGHVFGTPTSYSESLCDKCKKKTGRL